MPEPIEVNADVIDQILRELRDIKMENKSINERLARIEQDIDRDDELIRPLKGNPIFPGEGEQDVLRVPTTTELLEDVIQVDVSPLINDTLIDILGAVYDLGTETEGVFTEKITKSLGLSRTTVSRRLNLLEKLTLLSKQNIGKKVKWFITEKGMKYL